MERKEIAFLILGLIFGLLVMYIFKPLPEIEKPETTEEIIKIDKHVQKELDILDSIDPKHSDSLLTDWRKRRQFKNK